MIFHLIYFYWLCRICYQRSPIGTTCLWCKESSILNQESTKMRALWITRKYLSFKSRKVTAWGLVMSKIMYGIEVWGPSATERQIEQIQSLQNSIIRWVCGAGRLTRTTDLLLMTGMLSIRQLMMYRVLVFGLCPS